MQIPSPSPTTAEADSSARLAEVASELADDPTLLFDAATWTALGWVAVKVAGIVVLALIVLGVIMRLKNRWVSSVADRPTLDKKRQRVMTVADLVGSASRYVVWAFAIVMILDVIGLPIGPLLAGAGIAGLAIGFGAQTLVKDVISGLFLLFDDTIGIGDLITFNGNTATVEYVGLRLIKARKFDGELLMIPAGEMRTFGNKSIGFARAIVPVDLAYEGDVEAGLSAMEAVAHEWAQTDFAKDVMLEEAPTVQAGHVVSRHTARIIVQVRPGEQFQAERELYALIKKRFDERGVEIPFPRRTVYVKTDGSNPDAVGMAAAAGAD
ncbi:MAG TPA: mechanosensitive ion channel family protein [Bacteroidetes bacterium]|nr:mechanosensitive ion channel family protein [Bacteroidota bacterium]